LHPSSKACLLKLLAGARIPILSPRLSAGG
jgi:hypothetical protein